MTKKRNCFCGYVGKKNETMSRRRKDKGDEINTNKRINTANDVIFSTYEKLLSTGYGSSLYSLPELTPG
jgi:hypothetical protein